MKSHKNRRELAQCKARGIKPLAGAAGLAGRFITLEGIDGAGKSSYIGFIQDWLVQHGIRPVLTREPGGTVLGEKIRDLLLDVSADISLRTETLLMFASRQALLDAVICPALKSGQWVVSDRFTDSTFAFQGGGRGMPDADIALLERWVQQGLQPDLTLLFDLPLDVAVRRLQPARALDRFEQEAADFHERVRRTYLERALQSPRFVVINANCTKEAVQTDINQALCTLLEQRI